MAGFSFESFQGAIQRGLAMPSPYSLPPSTATKNLYMACLFLTRRSHPGELVASPPRQTHPDGCLSQGLGKRIRSGDSDHAYNIPRPAAPVISLPVVCFGGQEPDSGIRRQFASTAFAVNENACARFPRPTSFTFRDKASNSATRISEFLLSLDLA